MWLKEKKESDISDVTQEHNTLKNEGLSTVRDEFQKMLLILAWKSLNTQTPAELTDHTDLRLMGVA